MPRTKADTTQKRHRQINIRVTDDEHARLVSEARRAGMKLGSYFLDVMLNRKIEIASTTIQRMEPALFAELRRIGNNVNQIAHATNSGVPPHVLFAAQSLSGVLHVLLRDDLLNRRIEALKSRTEFHGAAPPETGVQLQGRLRVYPARRRKSDH